jgi:hypothetical protein
LALEALEVTIRHDESKVALQHSIVYMSGVMRSSKCVS